MNKIYQLTINFRFTFITSSFPVAHLYSASDPYFVPQVCILVKSFVFTLAGSSGALGQLGRTELSHKLLYILILKLLRVYRSDRTKLECYACVQEFFFDNKLTTTLQQYLGISESRSG